MSQRKFLRGCVAAGFLLLCACVFPTPARATIHYTVSLAHPEQHVFHVSMEIPDVHNEVTLQMPAWNALYQIRDFSAHVREVDAVAGSDAVPVQKVDKLTWRARGNGQLTIRYDTFWNEPGPFATQLNADHAFINPAMILMYVPDRRTEQVSLSVMGAPVGWSMASAANELLEGKNASPMYMAANYELLADAPIEVGQFEEFDVPGMNPPVSVVVHGDKWKKKDLQDELRRICSYETKLMGGAPYEHYTFLLHIGKGAAGAGGGMEHANSTAIFVRSEDELPDVAAHEFFHLWNVKRIRPATLYPVDYTKEQYTRALWFAEGVTSTYAAYTMIRTQLWGKDEFYFDLGQQISYLESRPADRWQSAEQSSLDTWLDKYPLYNRPQDSISYYAKGQVLGVLLDILIRDRTNNEQSLDDVMRSMNVEFAQQNKPYRDSLDVRLTAERVAGGSFEEFFDRYVAHAESLPYEEILALAGMELRSTEHKRPVLGFYADRDELGQFVVREVDSESPAAAAGLRAGDVITRWNGGEPPRSADRWVYSQKPGNTLRLTVRREQQEQAIEFALGQVTETAYRVDEDSHASEKAKRIREGILRGMTQPVTASR